MSIQVLSREQEAAIDGIYRLAANDSALVNRAFREANPRGIPTVRDIALFILRARGLNDAIANLEAREAAQRAAQRWYKPWTWVRA